MHASFAILHGGSDASNTDFSQTKPCFFQPLKSSGGTNGDGPEGIIVGSEDGGIYILRTRATVSTPKISISLENIITPDRVEGPSRSSTPASRRYLLGLGSPRSSSPASNTSSFSPFQVTKSRVVSSVTTEPVEAPKNYVDFEDEQEKLKNMVRRRGGVKDKTVVDSLVSGADKTLGPDKCVEQPSTPGEDELVEAKTMTSATISPASSIRSLSAPTSPTMLPTTSLTGSAGAEGWSVVGHTIPCERARLSPVTGLKVIDTHSLALSLHQCGEVGVFSTEDGSCHMSLAIDTDSFVVPTGVRAPSRSQVIWHWQSLHIASIGESFLVIACATSEATTSAVQISELDSDRVAEIRMAAFELELERKGDSGGVFLTKVGDWSLQGPLEGVSLHKSDDGLVHLLHVDALGHVIKRRIIFNDRPYRDDPGTRTSSNTHLPLLNPFKALGGFKSSENLGVDDAEEEQGRLVLSDVVDTGLLPLAGELRAIRIDAGPGLSSGLAFTEHEVLLFDISDTSLRPLGTVELSGAADIIRHDHDRLSVLYTDRMEVLKLSLAISENTRNSDGSQTLLMQPSVLNSCSLLASDLCALTKPGEILSIKSKHQRRRVEISRVLPLGVNKVTKTLWKAGREATRREPSPPRISAVLPIELTEIILGFEDGILERTSLSVLLQGRIRQSSAHFSDIAIAGRVTSLFTVRNERSGERLLVGGGDDGSIAFWTYDTLALVARYTVFLEPLREVIPVFTGRLKGCTLCISRDGNIAVIALDEFHFLFLVPASIAPLRTISLGEDNLLLSYTDSRARLWDIKTREFWRSMSADKADEMIKQGGWTQWVTKPWINSTRGALSALPLNDHLVDGASSLVIDIDSLLSEPKFDIQSRRDHLRTLLSAFLTFNLNEDIDRICIDKLKIPHASATIGIVRHDSASIFPPYRTTHAWTISPDVSALRVVAIVSLLQGLAPLEEKPDYAQTVSVFYTASISQIIGSAYHAPSLSTLARLWLSAKSADVRSASRTLLEAGVLRLSDEQVTVVADNWQGDLPSLQDDLQRDSTNSALALFICGTVAIHRYTLLQTSILTDVAKSIALYLHDEHSPHRALAIDLCSKGFPVWQQYVDAVEILQALFALATSSRKETGLQQNVGHQARTAVLLIASSNSPLFMTTVSMDILQPKSVQHRKSVMQLVIFLIHKKPLVLYSNIPRLVEAVVKSLDPNSNANREAVLDSATEILGHLVETYPTVDFHGPSQRLAVATSEGAVVMYDLKTATRLYVLESHKKRATACSFSPDGRRLVTLSLEEHTVLVWKVGSSFSSFFMPGAPPRQGRSGSEPFKTYNFNIGDEGNLSLAATLDFVKFEWISDRSVRIQIQEAMLTFAT